MDHEHPRGADDYWYLEHLEQVHLIKASDSFSRATLMALHRGAHVQEHEVEVAHMVAPFHDRRPRQVQVIERQRPVRSVVPNTEVSPEDEQ